MWEARRVLRWTGLDDLPGDLAGTAVTIGVFDGVHLGHRATIGRLLSLARETGVPGVVMTFEPHPLAVVRPDAAPARLTTARHKAELIERLGVDALCTVAFTRAFSELGPAEFVTKVLVGALRARAVVVGANFRFGHRAAGDVAMLRELAEPAGLVVQAVELVGEGPRPWSSTYVRERVAEGDVEAAAEVLGRLHRVEGIVLRGDSRGRALGYPTANLAAAEGFAVPADGVYAGYLTARPGAAGAQRWPAAISVGTNPTFDGVDRRVEAHVLDRDVDLYDVEVAVEFDSRLRGMERFESTEALVEQIRRDVEQTRSALA